MNSYILFHFFWLRTVNMLWMFLLIGILHPCSCVPPQPQATREARCHRTRANERIKDLERYNTAVSNCSMFHGHLTDFRSCALNQCPVREQSWCIETIDTCRNGRDASTAASTPSSSATIDDATAPVMTTKAPLSEDKGSISSSHVLEGIKIGLILIGVIGLILLIGVGGFIMCCKIVGRHDDIMRQLQRSPENRKAEMIQPVQNQGASGQNSWNNSGGQDVLPHGESHESNLASGRLINTQH